MATDPLSPLIRCNRRRIIVSAAIVFHWAMFVLVVIVGVLGLLHDSWPKQDSGILDQCPRADWSFIVVAAPRAVWLSSSPFPARTAQRVLAASPAAFQARCI